MGSRRRKAPTKRRQAATRLTPRDFDPKTRARQRYVAELDDFQAHVTLKETRQALTVRQGFLHALLADPRVSQWLIDRFQTGMRRRLELDGVLALVLDELGVPWLWCVERILDVFVGMVQGVTTTDPAGDGTTVLEIPEPHEVHEREIEAALLAPPIIVVFTTGEGEGVDEAITRLTAVYEAAKSQLASSAASQTGARGSKQPARGASGAAGTTKTASPSHSTVSTPCIIAMASTERAYATGLTRPSDF